MNTSLPTMQRNILICARHIDLVNDLRAAFQRTLPAVEGSKHANPAVTILSRQLQESLTVPTISSTHTHAHKTKHPQRVGWNLVSSQWFSNSTMSLVRNQKCQRLRNKPDQLFAVKTPFCEMLGFVCKQRCCNRCQDSTPGSVAKIDFALSLTRKQNTAYLTDCERTVLQSLGWFLRL